MQILNPEIVSVMAFAPASSANLAVGFDLMGVAVEGVGDRLHLKRRDDSSLVIQEISGVAGAEKLPVSIEKNVVSAVVQKVLADLNVEAGFDIYLQKGIPLSSGMGGSASSAVVAAVAINAFLSIPMSLEKVAEYAIFGEHVATGNFHGDNAIPSLYGGLCFVRSVDPLKVIQLPNLGLHLVVVHPDLEIETKVAREYLKQPFELETVVEQTSNLAGVMAALYTQDKALLKECMVDVLIEPRRKALIPGFDEVQNAALKEGAIACSISGAGPSMFALVETKEQGKRVAIAMKEKFQNFNLTSQSWVTNLEAPGARIEDIIKIEDLT